MKGPLQGLKVTRIVTTEKTIHRCFQDCPYYSREGNVMRCEHIMAPDDGFIIDHPEADNGFPRKCPILRQVLDAAKGKKK
jgi:hypothetical protein